MKARIRSITTMKITNPQLMLGLLLAIGAALGFSIKAIFVKLAYNHGVDTVLPWHCFPP